MNADEKTTDQQADDESTANIGDAGTKGTGSAGAQADDTTAEGGPVANSGDAGTKGTGSAG